MRIVPILVSADNYAYFLIDKISKKAAVIDPFDIHKIRTEAKNLDVEIVANLTTHHHQDHSGGNRVLFDANPPQFT